MKIIQGIVSFIIHLLLLLVAVDATWMIFKGLDYHPLGAISINILPESITPVTRGQFIYYWFGAVVLILISLIAHYSGWKSGRHKGIRVKTVEGETMLLNPASLNSFVRVQVENHPSVVAHNLRVKQSGAKGLSVSGSVTVQPSRSLPEIEYELNTLIRQGFERVMGIKKINDVTLVLSVTKKDMQRMTAANKSPQGPRKAIDAPVKTTLPDSAAPASTGSAAAAGTVAAGGVAGAAAALDTAATEGTTSPPATSPDAPLADVPESGEPQDSTLGDGPLESGEPDTMDDPFDPAGQPDPDLEPESDADAEDSLDSGSAGDIAGQPEEEAEKDKW